MKAQFIELAVGDQFIFNNVKYTKIDPQKVTCCKTLNAVNTENNEKVMIGLSNQVEKIVPNSDNQ